MSYRLCEGVTLEHVDGHDILITGRGDAAVLNETGEYILNLLLESTDCEDIVEKTAAMYKTDSDTVSLDVEKLICDLMDKNLIESI